MTIDINQFWNLLSESRLLQPSKLQKLFAEFNSAGQESTARTAAKWLVNRQAISSYQAQIILAGYPGPFYYGNYTLLDRFDKGQLKGSFKAKHQSSQHPVLLEFLPGEREEDLENWQRIESRVEKTALLRHPHLLSVYESVALPHHRFVVTELPGGVPLSLKLPRKGRIPWENACLLFAQAAAGLAQLHENGIVHGAVSPRVIWLEKGGLARIRLSFQTDPEFGEPDPEQKGAESKFDYLPPEWSDQGCEATREGDLYGLGCSLYRTITGRTPFSGATNREKRKRHQTEVLPDLSKYELPDALVQLLQWLLAKSPARRVMDLNPVRDQLAELSGKPSALGDFQISDSPALTAYRQSLDQFKAGSEQGIDKVPEIDAEDFQTALANLDTGKPSKAITSDHAEKIKAASAAALKRRQSRWWMPAAIAGSLLVLSTAIVIWAVQANRTVVTQQYIAQGDGNQNQPEPKVESSDNGDAQSATPKQIDFAAVPESERPILYQELIADDNKSLWETPTCGAPIDLSGLPVAPKIIVLVRLREISQLPEGQRVMQSLGPEFRSLIENWKRQSGLELEDVSQLTISLHSTGEFRYQPFFIVETEQPLELERLLQIWNHPTAAATEWGNHYYSSADADRAYLLLKNADANSTLVTRFALGSIDAIKEVAGNAGATPLSGSMLKMKYWSDRDRHVNVLYLRTALFNDEGQSLMGSRLLRVNRELSVLIPDNVKGGLFSLHFNEDGTYMELMFDRSVDLKPRVLSETLSGRLRDQRDVLTQSVAGIPPSPYWDKVRLKYDNMLADLFRNLRWGVEHGEVTANCWLPPMAAHNLIAASELVLSFSTGTSEARMEQGVPVPQTIEELLAFKRDLKIANPSDLNLLMADVETEINEDFRGLPFKFRIRLLGSDLEAEGITKNQRPSELNIEQQSLADILTDIMTAANPSKDITGPADPDCKLVWVVAPDPEFPDQQAVLITTRAAAAEKSYTLPEVFRTE